MFEDKVLKARKGHGLSAVNFVELLVTAFIPALLLVGFVVRPFVIPTGSMADTLRGAHFRLRCVQCGWRYDRGFIPQEYGLPAEVSPRGPVRVAPSSCPSCGSIQPAMTEPVTRGDMILVAKYIYQFIEPKRWDVAVFNNPVEPQIAFIKRMIGLPGETVEIIDGDIYIDGHIARKPANIQEELWMPVFNSNYQPVRPDLNSFYGQQWQFPLRNSEGSQWLSDENATVFTLNSDAVTVNKLEFHTTPYNNFQVDYAYNGLRRNDLMPVVSDINIRFLAELGDMGRVGAGSTKHGQQYQAWIDKSGRMVIVRKLDQGMMELDRRDIGQIKAGQKIEVEFAIVDRKVVFKAAGEVLSYDLGTSAEDIRQVESRQAQVNLIGSGEVTAKHIAIYRDIYYTSHMSGERIAGQGTENNPITLETDQFYTLGDNSPASSDSRLWNTQGIGNSGKRYQQGIVPREYLIGRPLMVFWPGGYKPPMVPIGIIPDVGKIRTVKGGSGPIYPGQ